MEATYCDHMVCDQAQVELAQAKMLAQERPGCLLCFEGAPTCHRRLVAAMIVAETEQPVAHLQVPPG
jgi:hypothetical protein